MDKKTDWFIFPPYEYYSSEELTKEKKNELIAQGKKCYEVVFNKTEKEFHEYIKNR